MGRAERRRVSEERPETEIPEETEISRRRTPDRERRHTEHSPHVRGERSPPQKRESVCPQERERNPPKMTGVLKDERAANLHLHLGELRPGMAAAPLTYHTSRTGSPYPEQLHCDPGCVDVGPGSETITATALDVRANDRERWCAECYHWSVDHESAEATCTLLVHMIEVREGLEDPSTTGRAALLDNAMRLKEEMVASVADPDVLSQAAELHARAEKALEEGTPTSGQLTYVWVGRRWSGPFSMEWAEKEGVVELLAAAAGQLCKSSPRPRLVAVPADVYTATAHVSGLVHMGAVPESDGPQVLETYAGLAADDDDSYPQRALALLDLARSIHHPTPTGVRR